MSDHLSLLQAVPDAVWAAAVIIAIFLVYVTQKQTKVTKKEQQEIADRPFDVIIVGAGVSGLASAYYLETAGVKYTIFEKDSELGGTWLKQRFHGVRFDSYHVQTLFSFAPILAAPMINGKQVLGYLLTVARDMGLYHHIRFNEAVMEADFSRATKMWTVKTSKGNTVRCNFLMNANGYYDDAQPNIPAEFRAEKAAAFKGRLVHSFELDQEKDNFAGKSVVVIGSGATAATMIPVLVEQAKSVTLVQRSPSFVAKGDWGQFPGYITAVKFHNRGVKWLWRSLRSVYNVLLDRSVIALAWYTPRSVLLAMHGFQLRRFSGLDKAAIAEHFTPTYNFGEQRPLVSVGLFECLTRVRMVTGASKGLNAAGVELANGQTVPADVVILATGFQLEYFKFAIKVDGKPVNPYADLVLRRDVWFEKLPNFVNMVLFARLDSKNYSCFTPLLEHTAALMAELIQHMKVQNLRQVEILPLGKEVAVAKYFPMSSGYFTRNGGDKCFRGDARELASMGGPWNIVFGYKFRPEEYIFS